MTKMYNCSPIRHVQNIKAPIMILFGENDRRVHPSQSLEFAKNLWAHGKRVEVYKYEDNHSLSQFNVQMNCLINAANFLLKNAE